MSAELCRVNMQLIDPHQKRKGDHPRLPRCDGDILRSLGYWRRVRRATPHCAEQYRLHRAEAMRPAKLPHDHWSDPLFRQADADASAAIQSFQPINHLFDQLLGRAA